MTSSMMRPGNFRHDVRGARVVEVSMVEYLRSKHAILKKIRRRLIILGIVIGLTALIALILGVVVATSHGKVVKFRRKFVHVSLRDLYFVYGGAALAFSFHGFYVDGQWNKMQKDGNRLVMHLRTYSILGLSSCVAAVWLGFSTLSAFGLIEMRYILDTPVSVIYLVTLVTLCAHIIVTPWLLRTVHRKANQADEYFGAEFIDSVKRSRRSKRSARGQHHNNNDSAADEEEDEDGEDEAGEDDDGHDDSEEEQRDGRAVVVPALPPRALGAKNSAPSPTKSRYAFYGPDGSSTVPPLSARTSAPSPRGKNSRVPDRLTSPRPAEVPSPRSARLDLRALAETGESPAAGSYGNGANSVASADQIPYASPVFFLDQQPRLQPAEFWRLWKVSETTGSFSCPMTSPMRRDEAENHLQTHGFHVVAAEAKDSALQVYFYAFQLGSDVFFLGEFVFLFSRQFFQATFKCKDHDAAPEFVARFNLQELRALGR